VAASLTWSRQPFTGDGGLGFIFRMTLVWARSLWVLKHLVHASRRPPQAGWQWTSPEAPPLTDRYRAYLPDAVT
jgi:hypothetical protein